MSWGGKTWAEADARPREPSPPRPPFTITPPQRARMEANRRLALARQQLHRHHGTPDGSGITISSTITNVPSSDSLTRQQEVVLGAVQQGRSVFVTGSAGTGKSFLLGHIIAALRRIHQPAAVFVTASTGIAACALGGQTLHSFAGIGLGRGDRDTLLRKAATSHGAAKRWRRAAALVIDEISMIDGGVFDALEYIARTLRGQQHRRWGGLQLVVSGDFFQLPPIKAPDPTKEFAFEADCWNSSFDLQVELTRVFRQSDSRLIDLLQGIRRGEPIPQQHLRLMLEPACSRGADHCDGGDEENVTRLFPRNDDVRRVNEERLRSLGREAITFVAADTGSETWRSQLRQGIAPEVLELCVGARVMLIKNTDPAAGLVNGSTGVVTEFVVEEEEEGRGGGGVLPRVRFERGGGGGAVELTVRRERWDVMEGEKVMARRTQVPLILAWALSVHKCQGMTLERLHTDLSRAFGCGMVYVALSRVRSLDGLRISSGGFDPRKVRAHPKVVQFYHDHGRLSPSSGPPSIPPPLQLPHPQGGHGGCDCSAALCPGGVPSLTTIGDTHTLDHFRCALVCMVLRINPPHTIMCTMHMYMCVSVSLLFDLDTVDGESRSCRRLAIIPSVQQQCHMPKHLIFLLSTNLFGCSSQDSDLSAPCHRHQYVNLPLSLSLSSLPLPCLELQTNQAV